MKLIAERDGEQVELGNNFNFETAYNFVLERDNDPEIPFYEGYDILLINNKGEKFILEADCWADVE